MHTPRFCPSKSKLTHANCREFVVCHLMILSQKLWPADEQQALAVPSPLEGTPLHLHLWPRAGFKKEDWDTRLKSTFRGKPALYTAAVAYARGERFPNGIDDSVKSFLQYHSCDWRDCDAFVRSEQVKSCDPTTAAPLLRVRLSDYSTSGHCCREERVCHSVVLDGHWAQCGCSCQSASACLGKDFARTINRIHITHVPPAHADALTTTLSQPPLCSMLCLCLSFRCAAT